MDAVETYRRGKPTLGIRVDHETTREVGLEVRLVTLWIEWRLASLRRRDHDLDARVCESVVGGDEFLKPKTGLASGVAKLVMRGKDHQNFHEFLHGVGSGMMSRNARTNSGPIKFRGGLLNVTRQQAGDDWLT